MKENSVVVKTSPDGTFGFWTGSFNFSPEFPDARIVTCHKATVIASVMVVRFPGHGVEVIRNYGLETATSVMF